MIVWYGVVVYDLVHCEIVSIQQASYNLPIA